MDSASFTSDAIATMEFSTCGIRDYGIQVRPTKLATYHTVSVKMAFRFRSAGVSLAHRLNEFGKIVDFHTSQTRREPTKCRSEPDISDNRQLE